MSDIPRRQGYVGGAWVDADGPPVAVVSPLTGQSVAQVPDSDHGAVEAAVGAAADAFPSWRRTNPHRRAELLHEVGRHVAADVDAIAVEITREMGKPLDEARGEVRKLATAFHYYAEEATRVFGRTVPNEQDGYLSVVHKEPVGVVGAITPWNYPVELIGWKVAASLAAGCTIVVKPSEYTPTSAVRLFAALHAAGIPAGVANLVHGAGAAGSALVAHPGLDKVAFTGSARTGLAITRSTASAIPLSMELGGSCPLVVAPSASVEDAVAGTVRRGFRNAGQICIAVNRVYVHRPLHDEFVERLAVATAALRTGDGLEHADLDMGPVANPEIQQRCAEHVREAAAGGAEVVVGGHAPDRPGTWYEPTVVDGVTPDMLLGHAETFGPVVGVTVYDDLDEAVALANGTEAGLAAYVYATSLEESLRLGQDLDFGNVAVNNVDAGIMNAPYGGRKGSGYGYEHGHEGLEGYLQLKHVRMRWAR